MSQDIEYRRFVVTGRVQGVFFRVSTAEKAGSLGLSGRAKNQVDGRVEVIAFGDPQKLDLLARWLHNGPPSASVASVTVGPVSETLAGEMRTGRFLVA